MYLEAVLGNKPLADATDEDIRQACAQFLTNAHDRSDHHSICDKSLDLPEECREIYKSAANNLQHYSDSDWEY